MNYLILSIATQNSPSGGLLSAGLYKIPAEVQKSLYGLILSLKSRPDYLLLLYGAAYRCIRYEFANFIHTKQQIAKAAKKNQQQYK